MKTKGIIKSVFSVILSLSLSVNAQAAGIYYLPDVTSEMSSPSYWAEETDVLMSYDEIEKLNKETILTKGTNMYDLESVPEVIDGIALNEAVLKSSQADAQFYLGWTYWGSAEKATQTDFDKMIENTQNPDAKKEQKVLYAVATQRTALRAFPSDIAIWDNPSDPDFDYQYLVSVRVNEPVVVTSKSKDGKYYLAKSICCSGWIAAESVAICKDHSNNRIRKILGRMENIVLCRGYSLVLHKFLRSIFLQESHVHQVSIPQYHIPQKHTYIHGSNRECLLYAMM